MANVNYASLYQTALEKPYSTGVKFWALYNTPNNTRVKWTGAKTIQVPSITTGGFRDADRDSIGARTRNVDNAWTPYTLNHDREFDTLVDPMDIDESNMALTIANITDVFNSEHKFPEMDKYMASKLHAELTDHSGRILSDTITVDNVLTIFDDMMEHADENEVPDEGRILYVTPAINTLLKEAKAIQRTLDVRGESTGVNRKVTNLDDVEIVPVASSRMKTAYNFTNGAVADSDADDINMILAHPSALYTPQKYEFVDLDEPTAGTKGKYLYFERKYWDVFVIPQKVHGIQMHITEKSGG